MEKQRNQMLQQILMICKMCVFLFNINEPANAICAYKIMFEFVLIQF